MPATTTAVNACDVDVRLDNTSGILTDISGSSNEISLDFKVNIGEFKVFGSQWFQRLACGKDASIELKVIYTQAADEGFDIIRDWFFSSSINVPRTLQVTIPNGNNGADRYTVEVLLESFNVPAKADEAGPIMVAISLKPSGTITYAVV